MTIENNTLNKGDDETSNSQTRTQTTMQNIYLYLGLEAVIDFCCQAGDKS
jgi:hypothetical protein